MFAKLYVIFFFVCQSEVECDDIQVQCGSDLQKAALDVHNFHRLNGGLPEMRVDQNAVEIAKRWMTESGKTCVMAHSPYSYRHKDVDGKDMYFGENVWSIGPLDPKEPWNYTGITQSACEGWYSEIGFPDNGNNNTHNGLPRFQYDNAPFGKTCYSDLTKPWHFTQMLWNTSTGLGCAAVLCNEKTTAIVSCNYGPGGNVVGVPMMGNDNSFEFCRNEPANWTSCNEELNKSCHLYNRMGPSRKSSASAVVPMGFMFFIDVLCVIITVKILFT